MSTQQAARRAVKNKTTIWSMIGAAAFAVALVPADASIHEAAAKTPGKTYCFNRVCHRVLTLAETRRQVGRRRSVVASFYRSCKVDRFNPCGLTSSGAVYRPNRADNAASPIYPNGTKLLVWNPANKRAAVVRINNAGPYWGNRTLDLSSAAATRLGFRHRGVARLVVKVIHSPSTSEARYKRRRVYAPVRGYMGQFASIAAAARASGSRAVGRLPVRVAEAAKPQRRTTRIAAAAKVRRGKASRLPQRVVQSGERSVRSVKSSSRQRLAALARKRRAAAGTPRSRNARQAQRTSSRSATSQARTRQLRTRLSQARRRNRSATRTVRARRLPSARPATAQRPVVIARPNKRWRRKYFSPGGRGA